MRALALLFALSALGGRLSAQGTVTVSNSPSQVPAPTTAEYTSTTSQFSPSSGAMTVRGSCGNVGACSLKIQAISSVLALEYRIISRAGGGNCLNQGPADNVITAVTTSATLVEGIKKNQDCTLTLQYRVTSLAYATHTVAASPMTQPLTFTITSP